MKINIKKIFKNLRGEILNTEDETGRTEPTTLGLVLSNIILASREPKKGFRPLKGLELGRKLYGEDAKTNTVEIDKADFIQIKELVEETQIYGTIITGQVLEEFENLKEEK